MNGSQERSAFQRLRQKDLHEWMVLLESLPAYARSRIYYPRIFGAFGRSSLLYRPLVLTKPQHIYVGEGVVVRPGVRLEGPCASC